MSGGVEASGDTILVCTAAARRAAAAPSRVYVSMTTLEVLLFWSAQTSTSISALDRAYAKASACGSAEPSSNRMDVILVFIFLFFSKYKSFNVHMLTNNAIACAYPFLVFRRASNVHIFFLICLLINLPSSSVGG